MLFAQRKIEAARSANPVEYTLQSCVAICTTDPRVHARRMLELLKERARRKTKRSRLILWKIWTTSVFYKCVDKSSGTKAPQNYAIEKNTQNV